MRLNQKQFEKFAALVKDKLGIHLNESKREMLQAKVDKLLRKSGITCYDEYYNLIVSGKDNMWLNFVDEITIHKTHFFREDNHFNFIRDKLDKILSHNPRIINNSEIKAWSSACSTGDEAYTLAMVLKEYLPPAVNIKILATDVSTQVIKEAREAKYILGAEDAINSYFLTKYFEKTEKMHKVSDVIRNLITFRQFNLITPFPFRDTFDIIFCRNVMIYFDIQTQEQLIRKFYDVLSPGGLLFIGHSESLSQKQYKFKYVHPTIYMKDDI